MSATIYVTFSRAGFHRWPAAPAGRAYLRDLHRHLFKVRVDTVVMHDEREIEFHDLLDRAESLFEDIVSGAPEGKSCETMARQLADALRIFYSRTFTVEVSEDGECGAIVTVLHG